MRTLLTATLLVLTASSLHADEWPQFRGPGGLGISTEKDLPLKWDASTGENIVWKTPLVGEGHASPIVWGKRVLITTVRWPGGKKDAKVMPEHHVLCYSTVDGKQLWDTTVKPGKWLRNDFRSGPGGGYAGPTPATDGKHVFVVFGSSVIAALDFEAVDETDAGEGRAIRPFTAQRSRHIDRDAGPERGLLDALDGLGYAPVARGGPVEQFV